MAHYIGVQHLTIYIYFLARQLLLIYDANLKNPKTIKIKRAKMKNLTFLLIACGLIFAASPVSFDQNNASVYAAIDTRPYTPKPIVIPVGEKAKVEIPVAAVDMRRYRPRPIIVPGPCDSVKSPIDLAGIDPRPYIPKPIIIPIVEEAKINVLIAGIDPRPYIPKPIIIPAPEELKPEIMIACLNWNWANPKPIVIPVGEA